MQKQQRWILAGQCEAAVDSRGIEISLHGKRLMLLAAANFIQVGHREFTHIPHNNHYHHLSEAGSFSEAEPVIDMIEISPDTRSLLLGGRIGWADEGEDAEFRLNLTVIDRGAVVSASVSHLRANRIALTFEREPDERFFGFGEQFTHVDLSGHRFPLVTGEQGIGRGAQPLSAIVEARSGSAGNSYTTYAPLPTTVTSSGRAVHLDTGRIVTADIGNTHPRQIRFEAADTCLEMRVWRGSSLLEAVELHTAHTGRYLPLPEWAHGFIAGLRGGAAQVEAVLDQCAAGRLPVSAVWIEDWVGRRGRNYGPPLLWRWEPNDAVYPRFAEWVRKLRDRGIRVLTYFNPFVADDEGWAGFREAFDKGYFVRDDSGQPAYRKTGTGYGYYLVDLTNPEAYRWMRDIIVDSVRRYGISGWMADYGEYLTFDCRLANGDSGEKYHQQYALDWIRLNREAVREAGGEGELLVFSRCGAGTVNRHAICFWEGDQNVTWDEHDGLASSITGLLSGGFSGIALNHSDIGGHTTLVNPLFRVTRSQELFWRWSELALFQPVFRTHVGTLQAPNHQFYSTAKTLRFFALMARLHLRLKPYFAHLEQEAAASGYPLIRHTGMHDPQAITMDLRYQFLLGADLAVFPVCRSGAAAVRGYLPEGEWRDPWTGNLLRGASRVEIPALWGKPPVLIRRGSHWGGFLAREFAEYLACEGGVIDSLGLPDEPDSTVKEERP